MAPSSRAPRLVPFSLRCMGSTGPDFRCPWCGRQGGGGYAPDDIGYPVCSSGPSSCLWGAYSLRGLDRAGFRLRQLESILCIRPAAPAPPIPSSPAALAIALPWVADFL